MNPSASGPRILSQRALQLARASETPLKMCFNLCFGEDVQGLVGERHTFKHIFFLDFSES